MIIGRATRYLAGASRPRRPAADPCGAASGSVAQAAVGRRPGWAASDGHARRADQQIRIGRIYSVPWTLPKGKKPPFCAAMGQPESDTRVRVQGRENPIKMRICEQEGALGRAGIEPATQGFSALCRTHRNRNKHNDLHQYTTFLGQLEGKIDPDLQEMAKLWGLLAPAVRRALVSMAQASVHIPKQ